MSVQWTDVTQWETYWAPDSGPQITQLLLSQILNGHAKGATLYSSQYSFTDENIAAAMNAWSLDQPANRLLFDSSCYSSSNDKAAVNAAIAGLQPDQWAVGTSSVEGEILHSKIVAIIYPGGTGFTFSGSFNLSASAEKEFNVADFIWSYDRANIFAHQIVNKLTWVQQNQQPQPYVSHHYSGGDI